MFFLSCFAKFVPMDRPKTLDKHNGSRRKVMKMITARGIGTNSLVRTVVMHGSHQAASKVRRNVQVFYLTGMISGPIHADVTLVKAMLATQVRFRQAPCFLHFKKFQTPTTILCPAQSRLFFWRGTWSLSFPDPFSFSKTTLLFHKSLVYIYYHGNLWLWV